jgi:GNAT superfamily N-acetyltransferase
MIVGSQDLADADFTRLARLHLDNLERSVVSQLGLPMLRRYYRFIAHSPQEVLFTEGEPGAVRGAAVLSMDSDSVMQRFVAVHRTSFAAATLGKILGQPSFAAVLWKTARASGPAGDAGALRQPEIVQLFVDVTYRNQRLGRRLLEQVDRHLADQGIPRYMIRTRLHDNEATLGFYDRNRFAEFHRGRWKDDEFVFMTRSTEPEPEGAATGEAVSSPSRAKEAGRFQ